MKYFFYIFVIVFFGCSFVFEHDTLKITDKNNDGYDDNDIRFLQKLIDNSQGFGVAPADDLNPLEIGDQIWVEGRLRSLKHTGGLGGFYLYGSIPQEIKDVKYLNKLVFTDNYFESIPEEIKYLNNLSEIILNDNRFIGDVPEELWLNKPNLKNLSIFNNYFNSMPESICEHYDDITNFVFSHNNLCELPSCISNAGIQSCDCQDYITMEICLDDNLENDCEKTLEDILQNCPLKDFWGETLFEELTTFNGNYCVDWDSNYNCSTILPIDNDSINFGLDLENGCIDCNGNDCSDSFSWIGDGSCDESTDLNFSCPEFNCDMNDCGFYSEALFDCYCQRDCFGNCFDNAECGRLYAIYGYDCCVDDGTCIDVTGDGYIQSGIGDGWCDDGSRGFGFNCQELGGFEFNCDGGDCGIWNNETGQCEPAPGQVIRYFDDEFYPESHE